MSSAERAGAMIGLDIAGIAVALDIAEPQMASRVRERYRAFLTASNTPQMTVRVEVNAGAEFIPPREGPWVVETTLTGSRLTYRSFYDAGWMDFERGAGLLEMMPEADVENYLRVLYAHLCARGEGVLLHAAGVVKDARGFVFWGPSGSGKSTAAHLSMDAGLTVLGDDLVIIRRREDAFHLHGVPFRGSNARAPLTNTHAELAGVYALAKSPRHEVAPLAAAQAVASLVRCAPFVMGIPTTAGQVVTFCRRLVEQTFAGELRFRKDAGFWSVIDESIRALSRPA